MGGVVVLGSVDGQVSELRADVLHEETGVGLELGNSLSTFFVGGLLLQDFLDEVLEGLLPVGLFEAGLLIAEGIDEIVDFLNGRTSSSGSLFLLFVLASESVAASDINIDVSLDHHPALDLAGGAVEEQFHRVRV